MNLKKIIIFILSILLFYYFAVYLRMSENKTENTVIFWTLQLGTFDKYINNVISEFEKQNPEIKIKWIDVPYSEGEKRTLASVMTDNPPDLVNLTPDFSLLLAQKGALHYINADSLTQFNDNILEVLKYNNNYFGIPFYATSSITLYNSEYKIQELPHTYDELFNLKINNHNGYLTMINLCENDTLLKILNKYNINSPSTVNSEKSVEVFKKLKYIYDKGLIPPESITQSHRDTLEKYMSGQLAFIITGSNFINMIKENAPEIYKKTKVIPQLTGSTNLYDFSLMNLAIPKRSKHKEAALKFAIFLTNTQNQLELSKLTTVLPVNKFALQDAYFTDINNSSDIESECRIQSASQLKYLQPPLINIKNKKDLNILSSQFLQEILLNNADINDTLNEFSKSWSNL